MAVVIREIQGTQETTRQSGRFTTVRAFAVYDDAGPVTVANENAVLLLFGTTSSVTGEQLPSYGQEHPRVSGAYAIDYVIEPDDSNYGHWVVRWTYLNVGPVSGGPQPGEVGYVEYNYTCTLEPKDAYRSNPGLVFPANGNPAPSADSYPDVRGLYIDRAGEPASVLRAVQNLLITEVVEGIYFPSALYPFVGKRNNATFLGANPGRLIYAGVTASARVRTNIFSVTHRIAWDEWYHMSQQAGLAIDGEPHLTRRGPYNIAHAAHVYWVQPHPDYANFNAISTNWP